MNEVKFPYGISNFEIVSKDNYVFVDKTPFIPVLEKERIVSFLRPRRFGKSLFVSILEYYYDVNQANKFDKIFGKYYIGQYPTPLKNTYRVLKFDFSGIDTSTPESAKQGFNLKVQSTLNEFNLRYVLFDIHIKEYIQEAIDAEEKLTRFFENYPKDLPIYFIFDEYDHFTNELLYRDKKNFIESVSKQGYFRKFFEVIKTATQQGIVDRVFITGVAPLTLDSLTSGFNIVTHLTHHAEFEEMMGFSEDEVKGLLRLVLKDKNRENEIMQEMKEWYNGYRFCEDSELSIYNSDMVLYYLKHFAVFQKAPRIMLDPNIAPDYGKIKQMFEVVDMYENREVLQEVLENGETTAPSMIQFSFSERFGKAELVNFLAYMGNLTIKEPVFDAVAFKIPNKVIEQLYWQYYAKSLQSWADLYKDTYDILQTVLKMAQHGNYQPFFDLIQEVLRGLSNRDFIQFNEKQIKMVIISYLMLANIFEVISEREVKGGYPDLLLFKKKHNIQDHHEFIIELKYLKKEQEHELNKVKEEAKEQVLNYYQQNTDLKNKPMLHLLTVVAVKDELHIDEITPYKRTTNII